MLARLNDVSETATALRALFSAGMITFPRLDHVARMARIARRLGPYAGTIHAHALNGVDRVALIDERGTSSYAELDQQSNALAQAWQKEGVCAQSVIGAICRNHRGLVIALAAAGKLGARIVLLNTGFAAPQLAEVAARENVSVFVYDEEFAQLGDALPADTKKFGSWPGYWQSSNTIYSLITANSGDFLPAPPQLGGVTLLTSGTTGTPKGASRGKISPLAAAQILDRVPLRAGQTMLVAAPAFHATGLGLLSLALGLRSTVVMVRKFEPENVLRLLAEHRAETLVVVPTMLQRIVDLGPEVIGKYDTTSLKVIFSAGSSLSPDLCRRTRDYLGDVLYNMYGSTEIAVVSVATPSDLERAPGTAGYSPVTCRLALYGHDGRRITEPGVVGRIFGANGASFGGYTDGRDKERIDGLLSTGDVGHFDSSGLLFVDGRDDDMIVSGGENVYPLEVENLLADREDVLEVAVIGVPDDEFGQRLRAFVVPAVSSKRDEIEMKDYVKFHLARFKVPREVVFLDELPRNATGKLLRGVLADRSV